MQAASDSSPAADTDLPFSRIQKMMLTLLCFADCMVILDFSIVNVAVPSIQEALGFTPSGVQWLFTGYGLVFGGFLLLGGRLSDLYGRKRIFLAGAAVFTLASLLGGFSVSAAMLVAMRCLQGLGAAMLTPSALALLMGVFEEGPSRNRAFGIWGTVSAAGYSIGVVLSGIITAWLGWRWILFVNVPFGILVIVSAYRLIREPERPRVRPKLDILGSVLVTSGLMILVYALAKAPTAGWISWHTWRLMGAALALLIAFIAVEARAEQPLMPLRIFLLPGIAAANLVSTFLSAALVAMNLVLTLYFQQVLHYSPFLTGLAFLPHGLAASIAGPWGGRLANKMGPKTVLVGGTALVLVSMGLLSLLSGRDTYWVLILPATVLMSFGLMPAFITLTVLATSGVKEEDHGLVSGIVNTTGQLGGALGLAVLVAVAAGRTAHLLAAGAAGQTEALLAGYRLALGTGAGFVAVALAIGWSGFRKRASG
ncbi:MAG: drug resistance transporter, EmrB/QacA subfamily [Fibrobacteres bacterium]|nr:drug resistance transporter, EmrB/QacA subfamily [Fibrobacterota bacterium]